MFRRATLTLVTAICVELVLLSDSSHSAKVPSPAKHDDNTPHQHNSMPQKGDDSPSALIASLEKQVSELQAHSKRQSALLHDLSQHHGGLPNPKRHMSPDESAETDTNEHNDAMGSKGGNSIHGGRSSLEKKHGNSPASSGDSGSNSASANNDADGSGDVNEDGSGDVDGDGNEHRPTRAHRGDSDNQAHQGDEENPVHHGGELISGVKWSWW